MSEIIRSMRGNIVRPAFDEQVPPLKPKIYMNMLDDLFLRDGQQYYFEELPNAEQELPPRPGEPYYEQWLKSQKLPPGQRLT